MSDFDSVNDRKRKIDEVDVANATTFEAPVSNTTNYAGEIVNNKAPEVAKAEFLLQGMTNAQITEILMKASTKVDGVYGVLKSESLNEITTRKIFVRGLGYENTVEEIKYLYSKYGPVVDCTIVTDRSTGYSKGYGFLTFQTVDSTWAAIQVGSEMLGDRAVSCNLAAVGSNKKQSKSDDDTYRKLFVRGLAYECNNETLRAVFSPFGEIEHIYVATDRSTNQCKGYGFVTFASDVDASRSLENPQYEIDGRSCTATLASAGKKNTSTHAQSGGGGYGGGYDASAYGYGYDASSYAGAYGAAAGGYGQQAAGYGGGGGYGGGDASGYGGGYGAPAAGGYDTSGGYGGYGAGDTSGYGGGYGGGGYDANA